MIMIIDGKDDDIVHRNGSENNDNNSNTHDGRQPMCNLYQRKHRPSMGF